MKKDTSSKAMVRFSENQKFAENVLKSKEGKHKSQKVFPHYIDYRVHDDNKTKFDSKHSMPF